MSKLRFSIAVSLDGYAAGPAQSEENPLGIDGERLHEWATPLQVWAPNLPRGAETGRSEGQRQLPGTSRRSELPRQLGRSAGRRRTAGRSG